MYVGILPTVLSGPVVFIAFQAVFKLCTFILSVAVLWLLSWPRLVSSQEWVVEEKSVRARGSAAAESELASARARGSKDKPPPVKILGAVEKFDRAMFDRATEDHSGTLFWSKKAGSGHGSARSSGVEN